MAAIVAVAATDNWNANGSWVGGVQPTAADDVTIVAGATVTIPSGVTALARSVTVAASGALAFAATTSVLTIGDASGGAFTNSGTITLTAIGTINFVSTSNNGGTGWGLTTGGQTMPNITVNGVGNKIVLQDALTATGATITLTQGTLDTNSKSVAAGIFVSSNSNVRTLTLGTSTVTLSSTWSPATATNLTFSGASSTITLTGSSAVFNHGNSAAGSGVVYGIVNFTGSGTANIFIGAGTTITTLTRTGTATKTDGITFGTNVVVIGTLTLGSNSSVNRLLVQSNTPGTARTITAAAVVITNVVDFMDITGAGAATWTAAATGATFLGDAGGNSGITFTTPATQTHTASAGGSWSDVTKWTSRVPLPQDNVVVDVNTTGTLTNDMPRIGASIDFTGFAGTVAFSTFNPTLYGSLTMSSGMTVTTNGPIFAGRGNFTITSAGKVFGSSTVTAPGGTYSLADAFSVGALSVNDGTFTTNNQSVTCASINSTSARTRALNLGTSTVTLTSTATVSVIQFQSSTGLTLSAASAAFVVATASALTRTVALEGTQTLGSLTYTVAGSPGALSFNLGSNSTTVSALTIGSGRVLTLFSTRTLSVTNWNVNGAANGYLYLPGVAGNYVSTPDSAALRPSAELDIAVRVAADNWANGSNQSLVNKRQTVGQYAYRFNLTSTGTLALFTSTDGTAEVSGGSVTTLGSVGAVNGTTMWLRVTWRASDGRVQFFYAADNSVMPSGAGWTQLGANTTASVANLFAGTSQIEVGSITTGTVQLLAGKWYRAVVAHAIGGTAALDVDLTRDLGSAGWLDAAKTQFTESSVNAATVTLNGALAIAGGGRVVISSSTPGSAATVAKVAGTAAVMADYLSVQDSTATGGLWVDGPHYANVSGNTGWTFADAIPSDTDTGAGSDVDSPISITDTDTGTSSDVDGGVGATLSDTDTSSGVDAESLAATMADTDTATAVDAESNAAAINDTDTGTANDLEVSVSISDTDTGVGADNEALSLSDTEVGSGTDLDLDIAITDDETATTVDLGTIAAAVDDIETGNSLDTESLTALIADLETAFGDDDGLIAAAVGSGDTGVGIDAESVFKTSDPVVIEPTSATLVTQGTTSGALLTEATAGALLT